MDLQSFFALVLISLLTETGDAQLKKTTVSDADLTTPEIVLKYGYPSEVHNATTRDGYIVTMHRIPNPQKPVVFLQHGLFGSSSDWILFGPNKALAYLLHNAGYDVWMGNTRGNRYSKIHQWLSTRDTQYWNFSFHEMGVLDLPAMIDYVLGVTAQKSIYYVGHSMGCSMVFVMGSLLPEYNYKIRIAMALAPGAFFSKSSNIYFRLSSLSKIGPEAERAYSAELFPYVRSQRKVFQRICKNGIPLQPMCNIAMNSLTGSIFSTQIDKSLLPVLFSHFPAGTSIKSWVHYGQLFRSGKFHQYDHGKELNLKYYKSPEPPEYNFTAVTMPVSIHAGPTDSITTMKEIEKLYWSLPNKVGFFPVPLPVFNHFDFLYGKDAKRLVYSLIFSLMNKY